MFNAIVLAAGRSERMGDRNKLTLNLNEGTIISTVIRQLKKSQVGKIIVVVGHEHKDVTEALKGMSDLQIVYNARYKKGQMTSIKAGLSGLDSRCEGFLVCLGDMPSITGTEYDLMMNEYRSINSNVSHPITRPVYRDNIGHPVIFHSIYKNEILKAWHNADCRQVIQQHKKNYHPVPVSSVNFFLDIDNEEEYNRLIQYTS